MVMDRFRSPTIKNDKHLLTVMVYIDLNSYRAGKIKHPKNYKWSSYAYYAEGKADPLITPAPSYLTLGDTPQERQSEYRIMVEELMKEPKKINASYTYFIGDPDWVLQKYRELKENLVASILGGKKVVSPTQVRTP